MGFKGIGAVLFRQASPICLPHATRRSLCEMLTEERIHRAEFVMAGWDPEGSGSGCLFPDLREEVTQYAVSLGELQDSMHRLVKEDPNSELLVRAQSLTEASMKRLAKEFRRLLSTDLRLSGDEDESVLGCSPSTSTPAGSRCSNRSEDYWEFDDRGLEDYDRPGSAVELSDLRMITNCMIASGYAKECISSFKIVRRWIVEKDLYTSGLERPVIPSQIQKMGWEVLEAKIKRWLNAVNVAVKTVFPRERILCNALFPSSEPLRQSCFAHITKDVAMTMFEFAGAVSRVKNSPEKIFRVLDMYEAVTNLWLEIETAFSSDSTSAVQSRAADSLIKLGEAVRLMLVEFEMAIQKDSSKLAVQGGGVHPLASYVMNYLVFLGDYSESLADVLADWPLELHGSLPEPLSGGISDEFEEHRGTTSAITTRFAWIILVLLCKLDVKAQLYKDVALSYLFLANNLRYVIAKVTNTILRHVLGGEWIVSHESKVGEYASKYERVGWGKVLSSLSERRTAGGIVEFNAAFKETFVRQAGWVAPDTKLREEIRASLAGKLLPAYRRMHEARASASNVRLAPDDLENHLSELLDAPARGNTAHLVWAGPSN